MNEPDRTSSYQGDDGNTPSGEGASAEVLERIGRYRVERVLGEGGFGRVYLAHDEQLQRLVAIKVPHRKLMARAEDAELYLAEARAVAHLDHPHIVPVFDVGSSAECPCFIVSKYIEGTTLHATLRGARPSFAEAAELMATVAEALHHAHGKGLVHRDVKPGNILIDRAGRPFVVDFGLALREETIGHGFKYAGTPAYMSPEQARGEGHRVDGRSDVFSVGVVLYEMLVGRPPFRADTKTELLEQVTSFDPRPPRQVDDRLPRELERIVLKAMAKRASERYTTARDLADDLRHFLADQTLVQHSASDRNAGSSAVAPAVPPSSVGAAPISATSVGAPSVSTGPPLVIVPKGLRSFDSHDAEFFLELLPGPRDRNGLPDSVRFWKDRIEERDPDNTFAVGLLYGPSGCGKSSMMKAGLLPRLAGDVIAVYLEATAGETEARLLHGLRKRLPNLPAEGSVKEILAVLRQGRGVPAGAKVLIVLDQFEQWLHAQREQTDAELVRALRQCDGGRVQCMVMVRDDFWMGATRFMRELEIRLVEGQNSAAVDLFPMRHAEKVLTAFGRAFQILPERISDLTKEQKQFVTQAVHGLAQEGKIVCVRLALFAEMMKGKPWTPASLRAIGGAAGVGVNFLEETFSAATAPPEHRLHQQAARSVLRALLPDSGGDIKGHMRAYAELLEISGYTGRPQFFEDLIRILDSEIRLITPTDPEGENVGQAALPVPFAARFYQLTHDFLVQSLRDWLTRKQKETRRGRAELLLEDRAAIWNARPENRQLPTLLQWAGIRWYTRKKSWTAAQRTMMTRAARHHTLRGLLLAAFLLLLGAAAWEGFGRLQANTLHERLLVATTADVPGIVDAMAPYRRWVDPLLRDTRAEAEANQDARKQLHASLALLPVDSSQGDYLYGRLLSAEPHEIAVIRRALFDRRHEWIEPLWTLLEHPSTDQDRRLRAASALAGYDPADPRWELVSSDVAATLVAQNPLAIAPWTEALRPVAPSLLPPLALFLEDEARSPPERGWIARVYGSYAAEVPDALDRLEKRLTDTDKTTTSGEARTAMQKKQANRAAALLILGRGEKVWPLLSHRPDPTLRSFLIERIAPTGVDPRVLTARLDSESDVSVQRAILLSLGAYGLDRLAQAERRNLLPHMVQLQRDHADPGIHGAAEWLLRKWQMDDKLPEPGQAAGGRGGERGWYVNKQGQTMVVVGKAGEIWLGQGAERHRRRMERNFAIAAREVTVAQFKLFRKEHAVSTLVAPSPECPVNFVSWYDAAAYCNWLSEHNGIAADQWCYLPNAEGKYGVGMQLAPGHTERTGYRLPTEAEWTYACQAGAGTSFCFGHALDMVNQYAWTTGNALGKSHPVGSLKPNDLGLFDMHGNAWEWTDNAYKKWIAPEGGTAMPDADASRDVADNMPRVQMGGSWGNQAADVRAEFRSWNNPGYRHGAVGFRPARTMPSE